jgi:uncharacterized protein (DUF58 family)
LWYNLALLVLVLAVILNLKWLIAFSVSLILIFLISLYWSRHALDGVSYQRKWRYRRGFPDEKIDVHIEVQNNKLIPVPYLRASDPWPMPAGPEDTTVLAPYHIPGKGLMVNLYSLRWQEHIRRKYTLLLRERGEYPLGPARLEASDPFGLFEQQRDADTRPDSSHGEPAQEYITVFPRLLPFSALNLPTDDPFGDQRTRRRLFEDPNQPMGVRDYQPEDDFRRIHWPATARTGQMQVKVYQPVSSRVLVVGLNVATADQPWLGVYPARLEQLVRLAATVVNGAIEEGYAVGLISNGCLAHADQPFRILPGRSPRQLASLLQALACVTPYITTAFEDYLVQSMPQIPYGATLVLLTAVASDTLGETLIRLRRYRKNTTVISIHPEPPAEIPGVRVIHLPFEG